MIKSQANFPSVISLAKLFWVRGVLLVHVHLSQNRKSLIKRGDKFSIRCVQSQALLIKRTGVGVCPCHPSISQNVHFWQITSLNFKCTRSHVHVYTTSQSTMYLVYQPGMSVCFHHQYQSFIKIFYKATLSSSTFIYSFHYPLSNRHFLYRHSNAFLNTYSVDIFSPRLQSLII